MRNMQNEMTPLTIANTLDQTNKQRIEAKSNQTLKAVIQQQNLAPAGQFDVYNQSGQVISNDVVANHRDATVYVGVAKVAGGSIPTNDFKQLSSGFPSIRHINQYSTDQRLEHLWSTTWLFLIETTLNYFTRFSLMLVVFQSFHQPTFFRLQQMKLSMQTSTRGLSSLLHQTRPCVQFAQDLHSTKIGHPQFVNPTIQLR